MALNRSASREDMQKYIERIREAPNEGVRIQEIGTLVSSQTAYIPTHLLHEDPTENNVISNASGTFIGVLIGLGWIFYRKYAPQSLKDKLKIENPNPWSRRFKTCFLFGQKIGEAASFGIPLPPLLGGRFTQKMLGKVLGLGLGLITGTIGVCCFSSKTSDETLRKYFFGKDSWSKYGKSGFVLGSAIGTVVGAMLGLFVPGLGIQGGALAVSTLGGAAGSVVGFIFAIALVPLVNSFKKKPNKNNTLLTEEEDEIKNNDAVKDKEKIKQPESTSVFSNYRTNYFRAGAQLGGSFGTIVGGLLGTFIFPVVGTLLGSVIGSAAGSIIGGLGYAFVGPYINQWCDPENKAVNSVDYGIRTGVLFGGTTNTTQNASREIGPETNVYFGASGAAFGLIGMIREMWHGNKLKKTNKKEEDHILPWTQRAATGVMIGSAIGALIGFAFPPFGFIIGGAAGGLLGGVFACAYEPVLRKLKILPSMPKEAEVNCPAHPERCNDNRSEPGNGPPPGPNNRFSQGDIQDRLKKLSPSNIPGTNSYSSQPSSNNVPVPSCARPSSFSSPGFNHASLYPCPGTPHPGKEIAYSPPVYAFIN